jgi:hypothetical protein
VERLHLDAMEELTGILSEASDNRRDVSDLPYARLPVRVVYAGGDLQVVPHCRGSGGLGEQPPHSDLGLTGTRHPRPRLPGRRGPGLTETGTRQV